jgi:hypothetical protein
MDNCEYRNGFLEREKPRRYEDKELYCSKRNHTGGLEDSWPLSSGERINEEPISNQETEKHEEPERAHNFEESQKSERNNPKLKRSFGCKLGRLLLSFQPSTKLGKFVTPFTCSFYLRYLSGSQDLYLDLTQDSDLRNVSCLIPN